MSRLDAALVRLKLAPSRAKAQSLIGAGEVEVEIGGEWKTVHQSSYALQADQAVRVRPDSPILKYVSRGGLKLEAALAHLKFNVRGLRCLDVGLSTGGFADCLLQAGAAQVIGVDVGHNQLADKLKTESKLKQFEGVHVRDIPACAPIRAELSNGVDLATVDVSFISLTHVIPVLKEILPHRAKILALVKPQFEVGPANLGKNGIVQDPKLFAAVEADILHAFEKYGFSIAEYFASEVKGQDGNQEFFIFATHG
jgi:23S rRNA (cytidine1920-2'-O)/16S rRNA (cytidine1409-2'-O)-methyltransferase